MKKKALIAAVLAATTLTASTAFAAQNPFQDLPEGHWAYDAVTMLAQDGVIDGYGDGNFKGDKLMNRYEMAEIVSKAVAKYDGLRPQDKGAVKKLEQEFGAELKDMDVRLKGVEEDVKELKKVQSSFKWFGDARIRYQTNFDNKVTNNGTNGNASRIQERVRLGFYGEPAKDFSVTGRVKMDNTSAKNDGWGGYHSDKDQHSAAYMDLLSLSWNRPTTKVTVGRQEVTLGQGIIWNNNPIDGIYVDQKLGDKCKISAGWGNLTAENWKDYTMNAFLANLSVGIGDKTTATLGYLSTNGSNNTVSLNHDDYGTGVYTAPFALKQFAYGFNTQITPRVNLLAEGVHNGASGLPDNAERNGWWSRLTYGNQKWNKGKTFNIYFDYVSLGGWACDSTGWGHIMNVAGGNGLGNDGEKGWGLGVSYMLAANTNLDVNYYKLKPYDSNRAGFTDYKDTYNVALSFSF
jgi:hypothetical protein